VDKPRWMLVTLTVAAALAVAFFLASGEPTLSQPAPATQPVVVTNFPQTQNVQGSVSIRGFVPHTRFAAPEEETVVTPVARNHTNQLIDGGTLETAGFTHVVLSLSGEVKGNVEKPGQVGAVLVPDVEVARDAFLEEGIYLFPLEVAAGVRQTSTFVASGSLVLPVAFPRYHVYFYNGSDRAIGVRLFAYLTY